MLFQRVNRTSPEKIFAAVYNSYSTAAITNGQSVVWDYVTDQDGVAVTVAPARTTTGGIAAAGVVSTASIAAGDYGLIQTWGRHDSARVRGVTGGAPDCVAGDPLAINVAGSVFCLESHATHFTGLRIYPCAFMLSTLTDQFTTVAKKIFCKFM